MSEKDFRPLLEVVTEITAQHSRRGAGAGYPKIRISDDGKAGIILGQNQDETQEQIIDCRQLGSKMKLTEAWNPIQGVRFLVCSLALKGMNASDILEEVQDWRGYSASFVLFSCEENGDFGCVLFERTDEADSGYAAPLISEKLQLFWSPGESRRYYPIGRSHPFDGHSVHEQIFFPALKDSEYLIWLPSLKGLGVSRLSCANEPSPLIAGLQVDSAALAEIRIPQEIRAEFPLEIRRDFAQSTPWGSRSIFRLITKGAELGPALLDLLDRAEADIQSATYFNRVLGMGPYAEVEHFFLIEDEGEGKGRFLPDDSVFRQPEAFEHLGVDVFLNSARRFRPNLSQVIESSLGDRFVIDKIRSVFGAEEGVICLVGGYADGRPEILRLSGGKPLKEVIAAIVNSWASESTKKITPGFESHLVEHIVAMASQVEERAAEEIDGHDQDFTAYCMRIEGLLASQEANAKRLHGRLSEATEIGQKCASYISKSEEDWETFANHLASLIDDLNSANQPWLEKWDQEKRSIHDWQESIVKTLISHEGVASAIINTYEKEQAFLINCEKKVAGILPKLEAEQKKAEQSSVEFKNLEDTANSSLQRLEQRLATENAKLREWSSQLNSRKGELDAQRLALDTWQRNLENLKEENSRTKTAQQKESASLKLKENSAEDEAKRLRHVRDYEIPEQEKKVKEASRKLNVILLEGYDDKLQSSVKSLTELYSKLSGEQAKREHLQQTQGKQNATAEEIGKVEAENLESAQAISKRRKELVVLEKNVKAAKANLRDEEFELAERTRIQSTRLHELEKKRNNVHGARAKLNKARALIEDVKGRKGTKGVLQRFWPFRRR
jgi:hypothetical protein